MHHVSSVTLSGASQHANCQGERLYGDGPTAHPFLYQRNDPAKFLLGLDDADVQPNAEGTAVIPDPRNDSHLLISQLHLAMLKTHNAFVDEMRLSGVRSDRVFEEASRQLRWHYQWIVVNEFLRSLVGESLVKQVLREGTRWFRPRHGAFIPLKFAGAAYRYGHQSDPSSLPRELTDCSRADLSPSHGISCRNA